MGASLDEVPCAEDGERAPDGGVEGLLAWARMHAKGLPSERAEVKALALEDGAYEGTAKQPFPMAERAVYLAAIRGKGVADRTHTAPVGRIRLDALKGIQLTVNRERLAQHMRDPELVPAGQRAPGHGMRVDLPVVVRVGGHYCIHDGHHRLSAARLRGETSARVRFIDLDADP